MKKRGKEITLDIDGKIMPTKHNKIALIDADTIIFSACVSTEIVEELLPKSFYSDVEWMEIESNPYYNEERE